MIRPTKNIKVKIKLTGSITGKLNGSTIVVEPELENLEVTPSIEEQVFKSKKYGFDEVRVNGITAEIDEDIKSENIKAGVNILGVNGSYEVVDTSDATATPNDILIGKTAYVNNEKITGTMQEYDGSYTGNGETRNEWEEIFANLIDNSKGENVTKLPSGIKKIRNYVFYRNSSLSLTELPESVTDIGMQAFYNCSYLALTKLPDNLKTIGESTFYGCSRLALTKLPEGMTQIPKYGFYGCSKLALTELPSNLTTIELQGFYNCTSLTKLTCKGDLKSIAANAFYGCSNLTKLVLENVTSSPNLLNASAFNGTPIKDGTGYIYVPDSLVDSFKTASNWSTYTDQIKSISELEG